MLNRFHIVGIRLFNFFLTLVIQYFNIILWVSQEKNNRMKIKASVCGLLDFALLENTRCKQTRQLCALEFSVPRRRWWRPQTFRCSAGPSWRSPSWVDGCSIANKTFDQPFESGTAHAQDKQCYFNHTIVIIVVYSLSIL